MYARHEGRLECAITCVTGKTVLSDGIHADNHVLNLLFV